MMDQQLKQSRSIISDNPEIAVMIAGCDLGKATAKFVLLKVCGNGAPVVVDSRCIIHEGRPLDAFRTWYNEEKIGSCAALAATGLYSDELVAPVISELPEDACVSSALTLRPDLQGPVNLVSLGARGYSIFTRNAQGHVHYIENDKCSSGTGETMVKIAGRFGLDLEEADRLASNASASIPITARCSVFAKSEMTHFGNQGKPTDQLMKGYFESVARNVAALLSRVRIDGPVYLMGGGARIGAFVQAFQHLAGGMVRVVEEPQLLEALGAAILAAEHCRGEKLPKLPVDPDRLIIPRQTRFRIHPPAELSASKVTYHKAPEVTEDPAVTPTVLGLDLGSTGSKAVLTSIRTGRQLMDVYDRTRGNPVDATSRLVNAILKQTKPDVRAIALTGSGREAAATVLRAIFPSFAQRIVVLNEIVAHATAAIRCDDQNGKSLSIVEIGGQDAKFIQIAEGQIVESDMNKACSAGTGSFLEEQAVFYGVHDVTEFTKLAQKAARQPDLGQMCTVFVAEAAAEALNEGFSIEDLFGGFQYSVIHNYINRVMGGRTFGERIFFQGKPASGPSLAWTLAAVTGKEVIVPHNPGAMGAWGIGLCAIRELGEKQLLEAANFDLSLALDARVVSRTEFRCADPKCQNLCRIDKTTVSVRGSDQTVLSGGACPKYEISSAGLQKLPKDAPNALEERMALLENFWEAGSGSGDREVAVPNVGILNGYLPWIVTFLSEIGLRVKVLRSDSKSLARGEERCFSFDSCAPAKVAHAVADADVDTLVFPKFLNLHDREGNGGRTCPMEQGMADMADQALKARGRNIRFVKPVLNLRDGLLNRRLIGRLRWLARELGVDSNRVSRAARHAAKAQQEYERALAEIGRRTLEYGREHRIPVVAVVGSLHVIFDRALNASIPDLLRQNGVLPLPMDCYPIPKNIHPLPNIVWEDANRALRVALSAREQGNVFPVLLSSFGCGPASFMEHFFRRLMEGYPHTALESDGHGGFAGFVTRIQAFLHTVRQHNGQPIPVEQSRLKLFEPLERPSVELEKNSKFVVFTMGDQTAPIMAAVYRSWGYDAVPAVRTSAVSLAAGRRDCSGKECLAYQLIWGSFRKYLDDNPPEKRTVLLELSGRGACRTCNFSMKDQISVEKMGISDRVVLRHIEAEIECPGLISRFYTGTLVWNLLNQFAAYYRPYESEVGEVDRIYQEYCNELIRILERPAERSFSGIISKMGQVGRIIAGIIEESQGADLFEQLTRRASEQFASFRERHPDKKSLRTIFLTGDIYLRLDDFGSDSIIRRLNARGMRVIVEPLWALAEYLVEERSAELFNMPQGYFMNSMSKIFMPKSRKRFYEIAWEQNPWLPSSDVPDMLKKAKPIIDRHPRGEAPITVGSVIHHWDEAISDGIVIVGPWGCGPALIAESLLRHQRQIPMLFVYNDGSPIDERRLNGFAFRLRRQEPRAVTESRPAKSKKIKRK
jgi:activator of 2-hydroxyglutaryl-CoA dehydratase/predicted nucleotide-binding protein (sugar kinase/HSP70/actin superfamily)